MTDFDPATIGDADISDEPREMTVDEALEQAGTIRQFTPTRLDDGPGVQSVVDELTNTTPEVRAAASDQERVRAEYHRSREHLASLRARRDRLNDAIREELANFTRWERCARIWEVLDDEEETPESDLEAEAD